ARRELLAAQAKDPDEPTLHLLLGQVYETTGLTDLAQREYVDARDLSALRSIPGLPSQFPALARLETTVSVRLRWSHGWFRPEASCAPCRPRPRARARARARPRAG